MTNVPADILAPGPENHSNGLAICRDVAVLIEGTKDLPVWTRTSEGFTATFSEAWSKGGYAICDKHSISPNTFLAFVRCVVSARASARPTSPVSLSRSLTCCSSRS